MMKILVWIKRIILTLLSLIAGSFLIAFFICLLHSALAGFFSFIKFPKDDEILYVAAVLFVIFLIVNIFVLITGKDKEEIHEVKEAHKDVKKEEIEWKVVKTKPKCEVGDIYRMYEKGSGRWRTIKVLELLDEELGLVEITIDDENRFPALKETIIEFWKKSKEYEKNKLKNSKDLRYKKSIL